MYFDFWLTNSYLTMFFHNIKQDVCDKNEGSEKDIDQSFINKVQNEQYQTAGEENMVWG
jgi:hypothetical protein